MREMASHEQSADCCWGSALFCRGCCLHPAIQLHQQEHSAAPASCKGQAAGKHPAVVQNTARSGAALPAEPRKAEGGRGAGSAHGARSTPGY